MAERRTLAQLRAERARTGTSLEVEVAGVVVALEKLEANFKGLAGRNPNAEGNARRAVWIADDSGGEGVVLVAKTFLWKEGATALGAQLEQDLEAGRVPVLAVSPVEITYLNRGQLGTQKGGGRTFKLDPAPEGELAQLAQPLGDDVLTRPARLVGVGLRFRGEGMAAAAQAAVAAGKRLIRNKGNPDTNPEQQGAFGSAEVGAAPAPKKRAAAGGSQGGKKKKQAV